LAWAKEPYACIIFNLLTLHTPIGIEASARSFRGLIDLAIARSGSYYLTYHKFAKPEQVMACYPQFKQFLDLKRQYDPAERFQSDWYRYYRKLFAS
jgi:FAD/FMN-containing dehydrogenase